MFAMWEAIRHLIKVVQWWTKIGHNQSNVNVKYAKKKKKKIILIIYTSL